MKFQILFRPLKVRWHLLVAKYFTSHRKLASDAHSRLMFLACRKSLCKELEHFTHPSQASAFEEARTKWTQLFADLDTYDDASWVYETASEGECWTLLLYDASNHNRKLPLVLIPRIRALNSKTLEEYVLQKCLTEVHPFYNEYQTTKWWEALKNILMSTHVDWSPDEISILILRMGVRIHDVNAEWKERLNLTPKLWNATPMRRQRCEELWQYDLFDNQMASISDWVIELEGPEFAWSSICQKFSQKQFERIFKAHPEIALLKAWRGFPLTAEERSLYPLAYAVYCHKHAPVWRDTSSVLPPTWIQALELCDSALTFRRYIIQSYNINHGLDTSLADVSLTLPENILN